jgi:CheY-like chemotaxis protein
MVHGFCRQSGGDVTIESEVGKGTDVMMVLPVTEKKISALSAAVERHLDEMPKGRGKIILLIEDEAALLDLVVEVFERLEYRVLAASDGFEALEIATNTEENIDLVLSDVVMPGLSGIEVAEILKERNPNIKMMFMSGYPARVDKEYGKLPDGAVYLQKPVRPDQLARAVYDHIKGEELRQPN